jgi:phosphoribosylformimino-5-aminoimidazole carboxamide ribotide isomerase
MITIIPAIDIIYGKCVRLTRGDFASKKVYNENPLEVAKRFEAAGLTRLHLVDLDGAREKKIVNWRVLEKIARETALQVDFGGGIHTEEDAQRVFDCGAHQITAGSIAVKNRAMVFSWLQTFGAGKIILGADVKEGKIAIHGWQEHTEVDVFTFLEEYRNAGIRHVISTDISRDGALGGPASELYRAIKAQFPEMYLIASGGVRSIDDVEKLDQMSIDGVIIGKALYEGKIQLEELKNYSPRQ